MATCIKCKNNKLEWAKDAQGKWFLYDPNTGEFHSNTCRITKDEYASLKNTNADQNRQVCKHGILKTSWCDKCEEERNANSSL